jgi:molybdate transport system substrate-binding protein
VGESDVWYGDDEAQARIDRTRLTRTTSATLRSQYLTSVVSVPLWHIPSVAPWRTLVVAALAVATLAGCDSQSRAPLRVSAAVSLTESLTAVVRQWERETGEAATLNFAASNVLSRQIEEGAPADLFISADTVQMERLVVRGIVVPNSVVPLLSNQLVVVTAVDRPLPAPAPGGLADPRVGRVALGDPAAVPAGIYARQWLERIDLWPRMASKVVPTSSVRAALAAVEAGNADAAVIYRTDAVGRARVRIEYLVPVDQGPRISYPVGIVAASRQAEKASALLSWLRGDVAAGVFKAAGFDVPARSASQ